MAAELASWPRPHFAPGGGNPLLFYVVFGTFDLSLPFSLSKYRASGLPEWLEIVSYERSNQSDVFADYQSGPMWEMFQRNAPAQAREIELAPQCIALRGEPADPPTLDYFRDVIGIATWLLDAGGRVIYDPQMLSLWPADGAKKCSSQTSLSRIDTRSSWFHQKTAAHRGITHAACASMAGRLEREGGGRGARRGRHADARTLHRLASAGWPHSGWRSHPHENTASRRRLPTRGQPQRPRLQQRPRRNLLATGGAGITKSCTRQWIGHAGAAGGAR